MKLYKIRYLLASVIESGPVTRPFSFFCMSSRWLLNKLGPCGDAVMARLPARLTDASWTRFETDKLCLMMEASRPKQQ